ncbi:unnamed protein product [Durusdinium trenchii]|uniref:Acid phosphatase n=1 Tax=Durusdinium trenchii TaxID=1381693 RepID=A0ABP0K456_9DINO
MRCIPLLTLASLPGGFGFEPAAFRGYCGHGPWVAEPQSGCEGCELVQVQVIHRHGARTLWAPLDCWAAAPSGPPEMPQFQCDLPFSIGTGRSRHRLQKHYLTAGNCGTGSLLGQAERQFQQLAEALNRSYGELSWWGEEATRLYSCDNERNLGSLDLLSSFLFPRSLQATVNTMPPKEDPFQLPGRIATSPCDGSVLPTLKEIRAERPFRDFVTWNHMLYDCVLSARCAGVRLPESISEELADEALAWGFRQQLAAVFHSNWTTWAASKAWHAVVEQMRNASEKGWPRLAIWSTHDSTMIYMLHALQAWDRIWPGYATAVVLELYASGSELFVRMVRDGKPLVLSSCDHKVLCPWPRFLHMVHSTVPPCDMLPPAVDGAERVEQAAPLPMGSALGVAALGTSAAFLAALLAAARRRGQRQVLAEALL